PQAALPSGYFIAWTRVSALNQVEVAFGNMSGAAIDLPASSFFIKVLQ
ncbi:MAG: hypothetical protein JNM19_19785, partial [Chitinophagaceae bacterium]|nr:hypothetical protein [Chitinophagaceae bacterium]